MSLRMKVSAFFFLFLIVSGSLSCGQQRSSDPKPKAAVVPVVSSVTVLPDKPCGDRELYLSVESKGPEGDPVTYTYQWIKNGQELPGEVKGVLGTGKFKKGDMIEVSVTPSSGKTAGEPFVSSPVRILNMPPVIEQLWIEPRTAYATESLKAFVKGSDKDGDPVYYLFQWEKNGTLLSHATSETLERGQFKKGDTITVTATPDDREILGIPKKSEPLVILNNPPLILSSPPVRVEGNIYTYLVKAQDPDGDPVTFTLKLGPKGMEMDKATGRIRWEVKKEDKGTHSIEIEAVDQDGAKSIQRYTLGVDIT
jgi:hypothetical protein